MKPVSNPTHTTLITTPATAVGFYAQARPAGYPSSVTILIIGGLILLTIIKYRFHDALIKYLQAILNYRQILRIVEARRIVDRQAILMTNILFAWMAGIHIDIALTHFGVSPFRSHALAILTFAAAIAIIYSLKAIVWRLLGNLFMLRSITETYLYSIFIHNAAAAILIFIPTAILPYIGHSAATAIIHTSIALIATLYLLRLRTIFQIIQRSSIRPLQFILYLCTLEILPLLLLLKGSKMMII